MNNNYGVNIDYYTTNTQGRDYVVGDIHGCFTKLECELYTLGFDKERDRLFSVGDLVDRGCENEKAFEYIKYPWFNAVKGNHEQLLIKGQVDRQHFECHYINGGQWFYDYSEQEQIQYAKEMESLPYMIEIKYDWGKVGIVHAEPPLKCWEESKKVIEEGNVYSIETALWARKRIDRKDQGIISNVDRVYVGHTPVKDITQLGNVIYIDTGGCFKGGKLSIVEISK